MCIRYLADPADASVAPPHWISPTLWTGDSPEDRLAAEIVNRLQPLDLCNPVSSTLGVDMGPGTLVTCWGIPLNPETQNSPAYTLPPSVPGTLAPAGREIELPAGLESGGRN